MTDRQTDRQTKNVVMMMKKEEEKRQTNSMHGIPAAAGVTAAAAAAVPDQPFPNFRALISVVRQHHPC